MYEFWVTTVRPGQLSTNDAMLFLNNTSKSCPEWELIAFDNQGRAVYRKLKES